MHHVELPDALLLHFFQNQQVVKTSSVTQHLIDTVLFGIIDKPYFPKMPSSQ